MRKGVIITSSVILGGSFITALVMFIATFSHQDISTDISKWSDFGGYFGGVVGTIISIASILILGYITFLINKNSVKKQKELYFLQKRIDAYDELAKQFTELNLIPVRMNRAIVSSQRVLNQNEKIDSHSLNELKNKTIDMLNQELLNYNHYHFSLFLFHPRYGHIFKFNFESDNFNKLIESSKNVQSGIENLISKFSVKDGLVDNDLQNDFNEHINHLADFINSIKTEMQ